MSTFQENLKTLRIKAGLTQGQLAAILNISRSLISHYERGKRLPKYNTLKQLCNIFISKPAVLSCILMLIMMNYLVVVIFQTIIKTIF